MRNPSANRPENTARRNARSDEMRPPANAQEPANRATPRNTPSCAPAIRSESPLVELLIEKIVPGGMGLTRLQGQVAFVAGVIPGDRILGRIVATHRHHLIVQRESLLESGPDAADPGCPHAERCGGCQLRRLEPSRQESLKSSFVEESLRRIARIDPEGIIQPLLPADRIDGYRRRARLHTRWNGQELLLGFHAHASHEIVDLVTCPALDPRLNALLAPLRRLGASLRARDSLTAFEPVCGDQTVGLIIALSRPPSSADKESMRAFARQQGLQQLWIRVGGAAPAPLTRDEPLAYQVGGCAIRFEADDFVQGHAEQNKRLVELALELAGTGGRAWDLFCGIGNFTIPLAERFDAVVAADLLPGSLRRCVENGRLAGLETRIQTRRVDLFRDEGVDTLPWDGATPEVILLDPPRNGAESVCRRAVATKTARLVYISCDPATFARDAATLIAGGYGLERVQPIDLFPHTRHVELVARFTHMTDG
ncbi:23S rRNA (uracil(1939)-C(5))-methyltransferase RlmD [Candidatus Magnetaquiglobus chichijimensis]